MATPTRRIVTKINFLPEDKGTVFLRDADNKMPDCTMSYSKTHNVKLLLLCKKHFIC